MNYLSLVFVFSCLCILNGASRVEAASRITRESETQPEATENGAQQQLMTAFDTLKKSMDELASKFNSEDIVQGFQKFTSKLENYAKEAMDQITANAKAGETPNVEQPKDVQQPE